MRGFIYKAIIITFIFIIGFEFTIGKRIDPIVENIDKFTNEQGRKELVNKLRKEMRNAIKKDNYLSTEDAKLINEFINKLKKELSNQ